AQASPTPPPTAASAQPASTSEPRVSSIATGKPAIIVDHTSVALFEQIPEKYLAAARDLRMVYGDRSVGWNINQYLDCLAQPSWGDSPAFCRRDYLPGSDEFTTYGPNRAVSGEAGESIRFTPDPVRYNRANWLFAEISDSWSDYTERFITEFAPGYLESMDVLSYQFTYLHVSGDNGIADPATGYFADNPDSFDIVDLEAFIAQHPEKTFFFWTTSLARGIGTQEATDFNDQMRDYVGKNGLILFDVADIESHTPAGEPCYDNRDGVEFCTKNGNCENFPDDGVEFLALCREYTTELEGGHLGAVSGGGIQLAKAFWVLMAQIAGWQP
ncbi:MAG TPA: hypothetical protein VN363_04640, partial [Anaerolineales bacterium]|nr:hypothetical protein [Anaerolineales bacterium]